MNVTSNNATPPPTPGLISVIMPCYNAAPYLEEAVASVLDQSYPHVELCVVDDGSDDGSMVILQKLAAAHPARIQLLSQDRKGPYPARNVGLHHARGEFVAFLDADDYWDRACLEKLQRALSAHTADLAYCGWQNIGAGGPGNEPYIPPKYEADDLTLAFLRSCPWPIHAALIRRSVIDTVGGFSERRFSAMDYDLWLRILGHTRNIVQVPEVLAFYRWHGTGQISAKSKKWRQVLDAMEARRNFVHLYPERVQHLNKAVLKEQVEGKLLQEAYRAYWRRELLSAQKLFREAATRGAWRGRDLKYILPALLPATLFRGVVHWFDRRREEPTQ